MNAALPRVAQASLEGAAVNASARRPSTEACLQAVVQANGCLLAAPDLASGMQAMAPVNAWIALASELVSFETLEIQVSSAP